MMASTVVVLVLTLFVGSGYGIDASNSSSDAIQLLVEQHIIASYRQDSMIWTGGVGFAVVVLLGPGDIDRPSSNFSLLYRQSRLCDGYPEICQQTISPKIVVVGPEVWCTDHVVFPTAEDSINYVRSLSYAAHLAEPMALDSLDSLWTNFQQFYNASPSSILLFSSTARCLNNATCRQIIISKLRQPRFNSTSRFVAYNVGMFEEFGQRPYVTDRTKQSMARRGMTVVETRYFHQHLDRRQFRSTPGSVQHCLSECVELYPIRCCKNCTMAKQLFIDELVVQVAPLNNGRLMVEKTKTWMTAVLAQGTDCEFQDETLPQSFAGKMVSCVQECSAKPKLIYNCPFARHFGFGPVRREETCVVDLLVDLQYFDWERYVCSGPYRGPLCSRYSRNSITAGHSLADCSRRVQDQNVATAEGSDFCCFSDDCVNGTCFRNYVYAIDCGSPGRYTSHGRRCREDHVCGLHGKPFYWCRTGTGNDDWDYCCSMGATCSLNPGSMQDRCDVSGVSRRGEHTARCGGKSRVTVDGTPCRADWPCSTHGREYYWCYTDSAGNWDYCCQPYHRCDYNDDRYKWCYTDLANSHFAWCSI